MSNLCVCCRHIGGTGARLRSNDQECIPCYPGGGADLCPTASVPANAEEGSTSIVTVLEVEHGAPCLAQRPTNAT